MCGKDGKVTNGRGYPGSSVGKESACNMGDPSSIPREGIGYPLQYSWTSLVAQTVKNPPAMGRPGFHPWIGKIPGGRHGNLLQQPCLENPHGQRSLEGYSSWGRKESDTIEQLSTALSAWISLDGLNSTFSHLPFSINEFLR